MLVYPIIVFQFFFHNDMEKVSLENSNLKTGDIIMFKYDDPLIYTTKSNGLNIQYFPQLVREIVTGVMYWLQGMYTHSGIIVEMNGAPYLWHLGSDPQYDILSQKVVLSTPALTTLDSIDVYKGPAYVFRCNKKIDIEVMDIVNNLSHIKFNGNTLLTAFVNGFKITPMAPKNKMMCTDFVETVMGELNIIDKKKN